MTVQESPTVTRKLSENTVVRFGATLVANILRAGFSFLSGIVIARGLGVSGYGDLNFLLGSFVAVNQLLDSGTSQAFYTFISQRRRGYSFFVVYLVWTIGVQFLGTLLLVGFVLPDRMIQYVWVGHERSIILLAFGASFLTSQIWWMASQLGEAMRKTVIVQVAATIQAATHLALIAAIEMYWGWLTIQAVLWLLIGEYTLLAVILGKRFLRESISGVTEKDDTIKTVVNEFVSYCKPLFVYGLVSFLYTFADRWLLQNFGGAVQQGFFSVSLQFANISLIATVSILNVLWKEIAEALEQQDHQRVKRLYNSTWRPLYFLSAWFSGLLIPYSREILRWTVGSDYDAAWVPLSLMLLYPVHRSLGQLLGSIFYASGETKRFAQIGLLMMGISIPVTYFMLAPRSALVPGLGLGATGLAIKLVLLQLVGVSIRIYVLARIHGWGYGYRYQAALLVTMLSLGWASRWGVEEVFNAIQLNNKPLMNVLLGSSLYAVLTLTMLYRVPQLVGVSQAEVLGVTKSIARQLRTT